MVKKFRWQACTDILTIFTDADWAGDKVSRKSTSGGCIMVGKHMIKGDGSQPSFNLFGIKADSRWSGDAVSITTTEFRGGVAMKERADFRAYPDYEASFRDYVDFLQNNPRYRDVLSSADQPEVFAEKLQEAGYATDPEYGAKIRRIMNRDSLMTLSMSSDRVKE